MPKSTRCGTCGTPIKGHARRSTDKAVAVTTKIRKNGKTKEQKEIDQYAKESKRQNAMWTPEAVERWNAERASEGKQ